MPRKIAGRMVATETELLDFANTIRKAGGANVIEALLPAWQNDSESCLIANALNFGCRVDTGVLGNLKNGDPVWHMEFPYNMDPQRVQAIADATPGCKLRKRDHEGRKLEGLFMQLPQYIGNAALSFDQGTAFQEYVK